MRDGRHNAGPPCAGAVAVDDLTGRMPNMSCCHVLIASPAGNSIARVATETNAGRQNPVAGGAITSAHWDGRVGDNSRRRIAADRLRVAGWSAASESSME